MPLRNTWLPWRSNKHVTDRNTQRWGSFMNGTNLPHSSQLFPLHYYLFTLKSRRWTSHTAQMALKQWSAVFVSPKRSNYWRTVLEASPSSDHEKLNGSFSALLRCFILTFICSQHDADLLKHDGQIKRERHGGPAWKGKERWRNVTIRKRHLARREPPGRLLCTWKG